MAQGITIALARAADAPGIRALLAHTESPFDVQVELARTYAELWVARDAGDRVAAFLLAWRAADELHVIDLVVDPAERRRGIARTLLENLVDRGRSNGARVILLEVRASNAAARALYAALRFETSGERRAYYQDGEDAIEMHLGLQE